MANRRAMIGRVHELAGLRVDLADATAYAEAIGDDQARHEAHGTASPFYTMKLLAPLWRAIYQAPELNTADQLVLHAEQRMLVYREPRVGETLAAHVLVTDVVGFGFNDAVVTRSRIMDADDRPVVSMESTLAVQGSSGYPPAARRNAKLTAGEPVAQLSCSFDPDSPRRYADAADDHNPLHLDDDAARAAGHPSRIVHGMCTLATGSTALVNKLRIRPGDRIGYLRTRFSRPVLPGSVVDFTARTTGASGTYLVSASSDRRPVLKSCCLRIARDSRHG